MVDPKISKMEPQISKKSWGGSRPNSGGRRPGSGRKKGTPNKATAEIKELAQQYGPEGHCRAGQACYQGRERGGTCGGD